MRSPTISIVVPAFNEAGNVGPFYKALTDALAEASVDSSEILFIDDGSSDATADEIQRVLADDERVRMIRFSRNFGHQAALTAGLERAGGEAIITLDCDFQDPPELIPQLIDKWREGSRVVYARRRHREDRPFKKYTAALYYRLLSRFSEVTIPRQVGDYRLIDRRVLKGLLQLGERARYLRGMVAWLGYEPAFVDFDRPERIHGETHYSLKKMLRFAMDGLLGFSSTPLRVAFWIGLASIVVTVVLLVTMLWVTSMKRPGYFPLYKWLVVVQFGFMGGQFILLWIVGEYIGRIYNDVRRRPLYVIEKAVNFEDANGA